MGDRGGYRSISVVLLDGKDFQALSADARWVFVALKLNLPAAGIEVHYPDALVVVLSQQTGLSPKAVRVALGGLEAAGWLQMEGNIVWITEQLRYDPSMSAADPKHRKGVQRHVAGLPRLAIVRRFTDHYPEWFDDWKEGPSEALPRALQGPSKGRIETEEAPSKQEKEKEKEKEEEKEKEKKEKPSLRSGQKKTSRASPLPADWQPNDQHRQISAESRKDLALEADKFRDWAAAKGQVFRDWNAAFRNWLRNEQYSGNGKPPNGSDAAAMTAEREREHKRVHLAAMARREASGEFERPDYDPRDALKAARRKAGEP